MDPFQTTLIVALCPLPFFLLHADMTVVVYPYFFIAVPAKERFVANFVIGVTKFAATHSALEARFTDELLSEFIELFVIFLNTSKSPTDFMKVVLADAAFEELLANGFIADIARFATLANPNFFILWKNFRPGNKVFFSNICTGFMIDLTAEQTALETRSSNYIVAMFALPIKDLSLVDVELGVET